MEREKCSLANAKDVAKLLDNNEALEAHERLLECMNASFQSYEGKGKFLVGVKQYEKSGVGVDLEIDFIPRDGDVRVYRFR